MWNRLKYGFLTLAVLLMTNPVPAQSLPALAKDERVQEGTLRCGVTYYLVKNPADLGYAHIAVAARADSTVHHFPHVPVYRSEVLDSILISAFSLLDTTKVSQALMVSGDIDPAEIKKKLDMLSIMAPRRPKGKVMAAQEWADVQVPVIRMSRAAEGEPSRVSVCYKAPPVPPEQRNTMQALVTDIFSRELEVIVRHRLEKELREARIPYAPLQIEYKGLGTGGTDESFRVTVETPEEYLDRAAAIVATVLSLIETEGIGRQELEDARAVMDPAMWKEASDPVLDEHWIVRCLAHYRYGTQLAPFEEEYRLFAKKALDSDIYAGLLSKYASAFFDYAANLTLSYRTSRDTLDYGTALNHFIGHYLEARVTGSGGKDYSWHSAGLSALNMGVAKVKLKSEKTEVVSGGEMWTFSNGMRVIFKQMPQARGFQYALQLNGGLAHIPGLQEGEGGYIGPLLSLYDVAGIPAAEFHDMLAANGISLETRVDLNSTEITGSAPQDRLPLVLKSLLALTTSRRPSLEDFQIWQVQQQMIDEDLEGVLFRQLNPGYTCSPYKWKQALSPETRKKAFLFYEDRFKRMNDGVLILSGNLPKEEVKKLLERYLGNFQTQRGQIIRKSAEMHTLSGVTTVTDTVGTPGFHVLMDAEYAMTTDHFYTAYVGLQALRDALLQHLSAYGVSPSVRLLYCVQPQERFQVLISCPGGPIEALPAVRAAIQQAAGKPVDAAGLKTWKQKVDAGMRDLMDTPEGCVATVLARYAVNKDIRSRFADAIGYMDAEQVEEFLKTIAAGGRVEYIVP